MLDLSEIELFREHFEAKMWFIFFAPPSSVVLNGLLLVLLVVAIKVQRCDSRVGMQLKEGGCRSWARQRCKVVGPRPTDELVR